MIHQTVLTIPANTLVTAYASEELVLTPGVIDKLSILFPPGSAGLAGVSVYENERQIWPNLANHWIIGDNTFFEFPTEYRIFYDPYILEFRGYNLDIKYPHSVYLYVSVNSSEPTSNEYLSNILGPRLIARSTI